MPKLILTKDKDYFIQSIVYPRTKMYNTLAKKYIRAFTLESAVKDAFDCGYIENMFPAFEETPASITIEIANRVAGSNYGICIMRSGLCAIIAPVALIKVV